MFTISRSSVSATLPESQTVAPPSECVRGRLFWNNPRGQLTVSFSQDGPAPVVFSLCIWAPSHNQTLSDTYDESRGQPVPIELDTGR